MLEPGRELMTDGTGAAGWVLASIAVMASSGVPACLARRGSVVADRAGALLLCVGAAVGLAGAAAAAAAEHTPVFERAWSLPWGRFAVAIDGLSAAFLFPMLVVPALAGVYGLASWSPREHPRSSGRVRLFLGLLAAAMALLVVARDAIVFLMAFEVMTLSAFFLVTAEDEKREAREAGWLYLAASHVSFLLLAVTFTGLRAASGSFDLEALPAGSAGPWARSGLFLLALVAFGVKAGVMPFHVWLPAAHACAPSHVSAVLSGVVIKAGVYGIARMLALLPEPPLVWGVLLIALGAVSGVAGVAFAIGQHDLKRLLAYHSIENIGIIVMGLGVAVVGRWAHEPLLVVLGLGGAVLHVVNHAIFKSLLFLSAGVVVHAAGTREIDRLGGLGRVLPWTALLFTLGAVAICGLPPLNGFISEMIIAVGSLRGLHVEGAWVVTLVAPVLAMIGALACACFVKVIGTVFLGAPRADREAAPPHECPWSMRAPMIVLALLCAVLGVAPVLAVPTLETAARAWMGASVMALPPIGAAVDFGPIAIAVSAVAAAAIGLTLLLARAARGRRTAVTWDCGYARPTARMQYTGSSFASTLVGIFGFVLRPREHAPAIRGAMPPSAAYHGQVDDVVLQRWVRPAVRWCADRCSAIRNRQSPRIQAYLLAVAAATLGLLLLIVPVADLLRKVITR
jgi:hydrogenase-4 component B